MAATLSEVLDRIRRPLQFASKNDFASLDNVRDLDRTILALVEEALAMTQDDPGKTELIRELRLLFRAYGDSDLVDRKRRIRDALELLAQLEPGGGGGSALAQWAAASGSPAPAASGAAQAAVPEPSEAPERVTSEVDVPAILERKSGALEAVSADVAVEGEPAADPETGSTAEPAPGSESESAAASAGGEPEEPQKKKRRRRRRRRKKSAAGSEAAPEADGDAATAGPAESEAEAATAPPVVPDEADEPAAAKPAAKAATKKPATRAQRARPELSAQAARARIKALAGPVTGVKGVGPKSAELLANLGVVSIEDLLFTLPRDYQDRRHVVPIGELEVGEQQTFSGEVSSLRFSGFGNRRVCELVVSDGTGSITAKWFHFQQPAMEKRFTKGQRLVLSGKVDEWQSRLQVVHPETEELEEGEDPKVAARIVPIYPLTEGLTQNAMRRFIAAAREEYGDQVVGVVPASILDELGLPSVGDALAELHEPSPDSDMGALASGMNDAHRALAYDELFAQQLGLATRRRAARRRKGIAYVIHHEQEARLRALLPFELTLAQEVALDEIKRDMHSPQPMFRLLQGDVGSGKTVVAMIAAVVAVANEQQVAFMAPTEVVAEQHYGVAKRLFERLGIRTALLTGSIRPTERDSLYPRIKRGDVDVVFGTHALISEQVKFKHLGLAIIDEQHRFGVEQREQLAKKAAAPDVLVMSATPIPRSLALTVFGDMDVSALTDVPVGRQVVQTRVLDPEQREEAYDLIRGEAAAGHQSYVVYPTIDASAVTLESAEEAYRRLRTEVFPTLTVGLLHGRLSHEEKDGVINRFRRGAIDVLVSTTVVGVGVDVPNATVMLIEGADRFGLAELHQLRGRVGRGDLPGSCFLVPREDAAEESLGRLSILEQSSDGFQIAEADLLQRGFGDLLGLRQAGMPAFRVTDLARDGDLLLQARDDASALVDADPTLRRKENQVVKLVLKHRWADVLADAKA